MIVDRCAGDGIDALRLDGVADRLDQASDIDVPSPIAGEQGASDAPRGLVRHLDAPTFFEPPSRREQTHFHIGQFRERLGPASVGPGHRVVRDRKHFHNGCFDKLSMMVRQAHHERNFHGRSAVFCIFFDGTPAKTARSSRTCIGRMFVCRQLAGFKPATPGSKIIRPRPICRCPSGILNFAMSRATNRPSRLRTRFIVCGKIACRRG